MIFMLESCYTVAAPQSRELDNLKVCVIAAAAESKPEIVGFHDAGGLGVAERDPVKKRQLARL